MNVTDFKDVHVDDVLAHLKRRRPADGSLLGLGHGTHGGGSRLKLAFFSRAPERSCIIVDVLTIAWAKAIKTNGKAHVRACLTDDGKAIIIADGVA